jgi:cytochrome P450
MIPTRSHPDFSSAKFKAEPHGYFAELRRAAAVHEVELRHGSRAWFVVRYDDAVSVLANPLFAKDPANARGGRPPWLPGPLRALSRNMLDIDEPDHRRLRNLVQKAFTPRIVEELRPRIAEIAARLLNDAQERRRNEIDLIADYASPIPVTVIAEMLGVQESDRKKFRQWSEHIVAADTSVWHKLRAIPAGIRFIVFLRRLIRDRRKTPGNDLLSRLIEVHDSGDRLTSDELLAMCFLLLVAGHETTVNLIGNGMLALLRHPAEMARLRSEPNLLASAVEEMLRFDGPLQMATERYARADVEVSGVTIPKGALVYVVLASANRDEATFAEADSFKIARDPNRHLAFGHGIHYCLGAPLARLEGQIAIQMLLQRFGNIESAHDALHWRRGLVMRGLGSLPVRVSA